MNINIDNTATEEKIQSKICSTDFCEFRVLKLIFHIKLHRHCNMYNINSF